MPRLKAEWDPESEKLRQSIVEYERKYLWDNIDSIKPIPTEKEFASLAGCKAPSDVVKMMTKALDDQIRDQQKTIAVTQISESLKEKGLNLS